MAEKGTPQHDAESLRMIAGWLDRDSLRDPAAFLRRVADDIDRRATDGQRAGVPEGWKLVPVEPTREMLDAYVKTDGRFHSGRSDWAAMLAAAPTPDIGMTISPMPPAGDAGQERDRSEIERLRRISWLIGSIFVHGGFVAETANERELESLLRAQGTFWDTLAEFDAAIAASKGKKG